MNGTFHKIVIITKNKSETLYEYLESIKPKIKNN